MKAATYYAITTYAPRWGNWEIIAAAPTEQEAREQAARVMALPSYGDLYRAPVIVEAPELERVGAFEGPHL